MSEERLNLIKEIVYTRCSIANITGIGMTDLDKEEVELLEEIERLHSIIKEVREYIEKHIAMLKNGDMLVDMNIDELLEILDKELISNDNNI